MEEFDLKREYMLLRELNKEFAEMAPGEERDYFSFKFLSSQCNLVEELKKHHPKTKYLYEIIDNYIFGRCLYTHEIIMAAEREMNRIIEEEL